MGGEGWLGVDRAVIVGDGERSDGDLDVFPVFAFLAIGGLFALCSFVV